MSVTALRTNAGMDHGSERVDLAAAFRLAAQMDWHEAVGNHFSLAVSDDGKKFLLNPRWRLFSTIRASELILVDSDDADTMNRVDAPDPSAWCIHGHLHRFLPGARCILHVHPPYGTALATLADPMIYPIDQVTAKFYNRVAIDRDFAGIADFSAEGERLARSLGTHRHVILGNHGLLCTGNTVAETFDALYFLERAARTMVLAYSTGQPLKMLSPEIAERTALGWEDYGSAAFCHFAELKRVLDVTDPSYAT